MTYMLNNNRDPAGHKLKAYPLVTVVMPSLQHGEFIEAACRSVLSQSYRPLRLFVIDGGSTDGTLRTLHNLQQEFGARLQWISEQDSGPANAINKGLQAVDGAIIGWLNADDLYADGCVQVIVDYFIACPDSLIAYGEAKNVDVDGNVLGRYPTLPPTVPLAAFQKGCFICQPTVFMRRKLLDTLGPLDESLHTAFDFEFWLRAFRRFSANVGYVDRVQAFCRIHEKTITAHQRRTVASEGVRVLSRYLGGAETHWIQSYITEANASAPAYPAGTTLQQHIDALVDEVSECFDTQSLSRLRLELSTDKRLTLPPAGLHTTIFPDGWAGKELSIGIRIVRSGPVSFLFRCEYSRPSFSSLQLTVARSWGEKTVVRVNKPGEFSIALTCPPARANSVMHAVITADSTFVPREVESESLDQRHLAYLVKKIECC